MAPHLLIALSKMIWGSHVFHLHIMSGAVSFALFNAIEPGVAPGAASHPVRQLLDGYLDPGYPLQFLAALFQVGRYQCHKIIEAAREYVPITNPPSHKQ